MPHVSMPRSLSDQFTEDLVRNAKFLLEENRFFLVASGNAVSCKSILDAPVQFALWEQKRGASKAFMRWCSPLFTNYTPANEAAEIFGREPSSVLALGDRPIAAYIRHLLYGLDWAPDDVAYHLIQEHGCKYGTARPMIRRVLREEECANHKSSKYYTKNKEALLFPEGVVRPAVTPLKTK